MELGTRKALEILAGHLPPFFEGHGLLLAALSLATASIAFLGFLQDRLGLALLSLFLNIVIEGINEAAPRGPFPAFLGSVVGRYADALMLIGASLYVGPVYLGWLMVNPALLGVLAVAGMVMKDYIALRARKGGMEAAGELGSRSDLLAVLLLAFLFGRPFEGLLLVCLLANLTALYRLYSVLERWSRTSSTK